MCWGIWDQARFCPDTQVAVCKRKSEKETKRFIVKKKKRATDTLLHYKALSPSWYLLIPFSAIKLPKPPSRTYYRVSKSSYYRETLFSDNSSWGVGENNKSKRYQVLVCMTPPNPQPLIFKSAAPAFWPSAVLGCPVKHSSQGVTQLVLYFIAVFGWRGWKWKAFLYVKDFMDEQMMLITMFIIPENCNKTDLLNTRGNHFYECPVGF